MILDESFFTTCLAAARALWPLFVLLKNADSIKSTASKYLKWMEDAEELLRMYSRDVGDPELADLAEKIHISLNDNSRRHWDFLKSVPYLQCAAVLDPSNNGWHPWHRTGWFQSTQMVLEGMWVSDREWRERQKLGLEFEEELPEESIERIREEQTKFLQSVEKETASFFLKQGYFADLKYSYEVDEYGPGEWWSVVGIHGCPNISKYAMKCQTTANMTEQERQWKSYKDICGGRTARYGELSKSQWEMVFESGYSGPLQTKACFLTELRHNACMNNAEGWELVGDGTFIDPEQFKVTDKDYDDFTRFYSHKSNNTSTQTTQTDDSENPTPLALTQTARTVQAYLEDSEIVVVRKNKCSTDQMTKKYRGLVLMHKGEYYVGETIEWISGKKYHVRCAPLAADGTVDRSDLERHILVKVASSLSVAIHRATANGHNKSIRFEAQRIAVTTETVTQSVAVVVIEDEEEDATLDARAALQAVPAVEQTSATAESGAAAFAIEDTQVSTSEAATLEAIPAPDIATALSPAGHADSTITSTAESEISTDDTIASAEDTVEEVLVTTNIVTESAEQSPSLRKRQRVVPPAMPVELERVEELQSQANDIETDSAVQDSADQGTSCDERYDREPASPQQPRKRRCITPRPVTPGPERPHQTATLQSEKGLSAQHIHSPYIQPPPYFNHQQPQGVMPHNGYGYNHQYGLQNGWHHPPPPPQPMQSHAQYGGERIYNYTQ